MQNRPYWFDRNEAWLSHPRVPVVSGRSPKPRPVSQTLCASPKRKGLSMSARDGRLSSTQRAIGMPRSRRGGRWGEWLVDNLPRGANLDVAADRKSGREIPFISDDAK